jgi:hypothetical protein
MKVFLTWCIGRNGFAASAIETKVTKRDGKFADPVLDPVHDSNCTFEIVIRNKNTLIIARVRFDSPSFWII